MTFWLALLAAAGVALCNGVAAVLQKVSADKQSRATSFKIGMFIRLFQDWPYVVGSALDGLAWILTLAAVHSLPLFTVQPIVAFSVVVSAVIEARYLRRRLSARSLVAIGFIIIGLLLLASATSIEVASPAATPVRYGIIAAPLLLGLFGLMAIRKEGNRTTAVLATLSGLAFGGTAVAGRMLSFNPPYWHAIVSPLFIALVAYGIVGMLLFTIALQRHHASVVNAVMISFEALGPICIGLLFLGDAPKPGTGPLMVVGAIVALAGTVLIAITNATDGNTSAMTGSSKL